MANNFRNLTDSILVHDIVDELTTDLRPLFNLATDFGKANSDTGIVETIRPGSTVQIKNFAHTPTAYTKAAGADYAATDITVPADIAFTLPTAVTAVSELITSEEYRVLTGAPRQNAAYDKLLQKIKEGMARGMKEKIIADFFAIITAANFTNETVSADGTFTRAKDIDLDTTLYKRKLMARTGGTVIAHPDLYGEYSKDHLAIMDNTNTPLDDRVMEGGVRSGVSKFTYWRTNVTLPADADRGFAFTKTAALFVARIPDEAAMASRSQVVERATVVDQESGMGFLSRVWEKPGNGNLQFDLAIIYKFQKLQNEALERIVSA
jgi:hypothetical protein